MKKNQRKGYSKASDIPEEILEDLNLGNIESVTLAEITAIDIPKLLLNNFTKLGVESVKSLEQCKGILKKMKEAAQIIIIHFGFDYYKKMSLFKNSDTLRGIGAFMIGSSDSIGIPEKINKILVYASDEHFGVREWAWMAIRNNIVDDFHDYYPFLLELSKSDDYRIRRFSIESMRPKGVWATHLKILKENPSLANQILNNLKNDPSKYVQDSVANWLNDLNKDKPDWIKETVTEWNKNHYDGDNKAIQYITKRATRNITFS